MMRVRALFLALALLAGLVTGLQPSGPALACSPAFHDPRAEPVRGRECALTMHINEIDLVSLGHAVPLRGGLVLQPMSDGNGCYSRQNLLVHDCNVRQVMIIGTEHFALMEAMERGPGHASGLEVIREIALEARDNGHTQTLADFATMSRAQGYGEPMVIGTGQRLQFGQRRLPLDCACRQFRRGA